MVSDEIARSREIAKRQVATYKALQARQKTLKEHGYTHIDKRVVAKQEELIEHARNEYERHMQAFREDAAIIRKRAAERQATGTPEGRAKVQHALEHGFDFVSLAKQLAEEGDKVGMASLREYLPYAAKAGQLPLPSGANPKNSDHVIKHAQEVMSRHESKLWDANEQRYQAELREIETSAGMMESNHKKLLQHLEYEQRTNGVNPKPVQNVYRWQGLPEDKTIEKGFEWLEGAPKHAHSVKVISEGVSNNV